MRNSLFLGLVLALALLLQGCGVFFGKEGLFRGKHKDYLGSGSIKPLALPEGSQSRQMIDLYEIPESSAKDEFGDPIELENYKVPRPKAIKSAQSETGVKIKRLAGDEWIFLDAPVTQIWPRTQNLCNYSNLQ